MGKAYQRLLAPLLLVFVLAAGCAPRLKIPAAVDGPPLPDAPAAVAQATASCRDVRSITAELGLSGRAGEVRLRGRAIIGVQQPDAIRIEGVAPFGPPVFILASSGRDTTLLLPRDHRVLRGAPPEDIVEALAGVRIEPAALLSAIAGCGLPGTELLDSRTAGEWARIRTAEGAVTLRRESGRWRLRAASRESLVVRYDELGPAFPLRLTLAMPAGQNRAASEVRLSVSQLETNVALGAEAFTVNVPPDAEPLTLEELRATGPLGENLTRRPSPEP